MTKNEIAEANKRHYLETRRRCDERLGPDPWITDTASTPADTSGVNMPTLDELRRKYPGAFEPPVPTPHAPGPKTREAAKLVEALRQARRGNVGQASATNGADKLPPHVTYG